MDIEQEAANLVSKEVAAWEDASCFVTDKISFRMRNLIKRLRKNYWGIFDNPIDETTGREKVWVPLTESMVEATVKNIDLDSKDVNFRAKKPEAVGLTAIVRNIIKNRLDEIGFGEFLDELIQSVATDGTAVWKTIENVSATGKRRVTIRPVDLLNFYIDPTSRSIAEATSVIERAVLTKEEFDGMDGWENKDKAEGRADISRTDKDAFNARGEAKYIEVFERWGLMPRSFITGEKKDEKDLVEGRIVTSGRNNKSLVHLIEENKKKDRMGNALRPYEECWYSRISGRWYGRGPAERLLMLQTWLNVIANIRINRAFVSQLGIFKIRRDSGITPAMIQRMATSGAIPVKDTNDIEQMVMQEASQSSYLDEDRIQGWAGRVTSAFESVTGEQMPSSTPATNAVLQARGAQSSFTRIKEGLGLFLERWITRQVMPIVMKDIRPLDIVCVSGEVEEVQDYIDRIAKEMVYKKLEKMNGAGAFFEAAEAYAEIERVKEVLQKRGKDIFVELSDKLDLSDYDVKVDITNESIDKGVLVQNLISVLQTAASAPMVGIDTAAVVRQIFDAMGIDSRQVMSKQQALPQQMMTMMGGQAPGMRVPGMMPGMPPSEQSTVTQANVPSL